MPTMWLLGISGVSPILGTMPGVEMTVFPYPFGWRICHIVKILEPNQNIATLSVKRWICTPLTDCGDWAHVPI